MRDDRNSQLGKIYIRIDMCEKRKNTGLIWIILLSMAIAIG
jgi:hypothetical protein